MRKRKTRNYPDMVGSVRKRKKQWQELKDAIELQATRFLIPCVCCIMVITGLSCSSHHYFSINAEEITNPSIMYSDSTSLTNPF